MWVSPPLPGRDAADHPGAVGDRLLGVEGALAAGQALADDPGVLVDEDGHRLASLPVSHERRHEETRPLPKGGYYTFAFGAAPSSAPNPIIEGPYGVGPVGHAIAALDEVRLCARRSPRSPKSGQCPADGATGSGVSPFTRALSGT